jgi:hypothetical protein
MFTQGLTNTRGLRPSLFDNVETDYLGMINFCLKVNDNALSGPSRSKALNLLTNDIFKALIIGYEPLIEEIADKLSNYRDVILESECDPIQTDEESSAIANETAEEATRRYQLCETKQRADLKAATEYLDRLEKLITTGEVFEDVLGSYVYDQGYKGLLTALRDAGCKFPGAYASSKSTITRPHPIDKNICLSVLDLQLSSRQPNASSKTMELNRLSNQVSRTILYGSKYERDRLAEAIMQLIPSFASRWRLRVIQGMDAQESRYLQALAMLLQSGISKAEEAVNAIDSDESSSLRLYDSYLNAFHRIVEVCLSEISTRLSSREINAQNDDFLLNFVQWEQSLRRNLTADLWKENPGELAGTWEFVDIKGDGGLRSLLINSETYFASDSDTTASATAPIAADRPVLAVELTKDGKVNVQAGIRSTAIGREWFFKPGPAHLDTCEFFVSSSTDEDMLLRYVGFIDRGQRIESR